MSKTKTVTSAAALLFVLGSSVAAHAQTAVAADVKPGDWAYSAVQDLASKGLIQGYPPNGDFLGGRAVTRFEMAALIDRVLAKLDDLANSGASAANLQQQIAETKQLVSDYHVELLVIGGNVTQAQADIAKLQGDVAALKQGLSSTNNAVAEQAKSTDALSKKESADADAAYSSDQKKKFSIYGYMQVRYDAAASSSPSRFPQGSANTANYNGNYSQGTSASSLEVRRARLFLEGHPNPNAGYKIQLDASGAVGAGATSTNQQVGVYTANAFYTPGDGSVKYPTFTAGLFSTPFGYVLNANATTWLTPERPMAFSVNNNVGLFDSQQSDKGLRVEYGPKNVKFTEALVNGAGRQSESIDGHFDSVTRLTYSTNDKVFNVGTSYYGGFVYRTRPSALAAADTTYTNPKKDLFGLDAQVNLKSGIFADGEFIKGTYEKRSYFDENLATPSNPIGADSLVTDDYVKGNQVQAYYLWGGYTFHATSARPLTLGVDYDMFQRSIAAQSNSGNALQGNNAGGTFYQSGSSFDDVNVGAGAMYNLDRATRLRLWYDLPEEVSHAPGTPEPPHIALYTAEVQVKF